MATRDNHVRSHQQVLFEEYRQVAEDIRAAWQYIFNFFRNFVLIQIAIVSVVGLSGAGMSFSRSSVYAEASRQSVSTTESEKRQVGGVRQEDQAKSRPGRDASKLKERNVRTFSLFLALIAFGFSIGGVIHNIALFRIAEAFVSRALALERALWDGREPNLEAGDGSGGPVLGHYAYMHTRIQNHSQKAWRVEVLLTWGFGICGGLWAAFVAYTWGFVPFVG